MHYYIKLGRKLLRELNDAYAIYTYTITIVIFANNALKKNRIPLSNVGSRYACLQINLIVRFQ